MKNTVCCDVLLYSLVYIAVNFCQITWCHIPENDTVYLFIVRYILMNTINLFSPPLVPFILTTFCTIILILKIHVDMYANARLTCLPSNWSLEYSTLCVRVLWNQILQWHNGLEQPWNEDVMA